MKAIKEKIKAHILTFLSDEFGTAYTYECRNNDDGIDLYALSTSANQEPTRILRLETNDDDEQVLISHLFIPTDLRNNGIGKKLILIIYLLARGYDYETVLLHITGDFRQRLIKRGAITIPEEYDTLMIGPETNLL